MTQWWGSERKKNLNGKSENELRKTFWRVLFYISLRETLDIAVLNFKYLTIYTCVLLCACVCVRRSDSMLEYCQLPIVHYRELVPLHRHMRAHNTPVYIKYIIAVSREVWYGHITTRKKMLAQWYMCVRIITTAQRRAARKKIACNFWLRDACPSESLWNAWSLIKFNCPFPMQTLR